ncbi:MAG: radical SAM protein [Endomicrobiaceae bacterium]|nr:radical SAM protein [Endomicrobiaceae bacterium]
MGLDLSFSAIYNYLNYTIKPIHYKIPQNYSYPMVSMYVTRRCNLSCGYCVVGKVPDNIDPLEFDLTPAKYLEILEHPLIKKSLLMLLCGGEPLLNSHILDLVAITKKKGKIPTILTNGILLREKWDGLLKSGISDIQLSLYDNTIELLKDDIKSMNKDMKINASYVLLRTDFDNDINKIENVVNFVSESDFKTLKLNFCLSNENNGFVDEGLQKKHKIKYDEFKSKMSKKYKNIDIYFPNISETNEKKCRAPWNSLLLDAVGNFGFCCKHQPSIHKGFNILTQDWNEVINSEIFCRWREKMLSDDKNIPEHCKDCYHISGSYSSNV